MSLLFLVLLGVVHAAVPLPPSAATLLGPPTLSESYILNVSLTTGAVVNRTIPAALVVPYALFQLDTCRLCFVMQWNLQAYFNLTVLNICGPSIGLESSKTINNPPAPNGYVWSDAYFDGDHTAYVPLMYGGMHAVNVTSATVIDSVAYTAPVGLGPVVMDPVHKMLYLLRSSMPDVPTENCSPSCALLDILHYGPLRVSRVSAYLGKNGDLTSDFYANQIGAFYDVHLKAVVVIGADDFNPMASLLNLTTLTTLPHDSFADVLAPDPVVPGLFSKVAYDGTSGWAVFCAPAPHHAQMCVRYRALSHTIEYTKVAKTDVLNYIAPPLLSFS